MTGPIDPLAPAPSREVRTRLLAKRRLLWWLVGVCVAAGGLIWVLWVLPVSTSVAEARPAPLGATVELPRDEIAGVWASGPAALLGLVECRAETSDGRRLAVFGTPAPGWDDTLWWMTPRDGFAPVASVAGAGGDAASIVCETSLDAYDGEFVVAGDVSGGASIGLGRGGNIDYPAGTLLALGAVMLPLFAVLMAVVLVVQGLRQRARA